MEGYIGEIRIFTGAFAPRGWEFCDGRLYAIRQYLALFALIGTTYGGDGINTFAVPNLPAPVYSPAPDTSRGRYIICFQGIFPARP